MEYQKGADQPDYKTGKDLAQGVMPQHNPRRAQYATFGLKCTSATNGTIYP